MQFSIYREIQKKVQEHALALWPGSEPCALLIPDHAGHGDLSTPIAMTQARLERAKPMDLALRLVERLTSDAWFQSWCADIKAAPPGYVNLYLSEQALYQHLPEFVESLRSSADQGVKIVIEHTNVNPNKAMHIGHLRNAVLGDAISRVLRRAGFRTEVQYYVDDTGVQIADTYVGLRMRSMKQGEGEKFDHYCWRVYAQVHSAFETDQSLEAERRRVLQAVEAGTDPEAREVKELAERIVADHLETMGRFSIGYDLLVWESDILRFGFWEKTFQLLRSSPAFFQETQGKNAGCWVIKAEEETADAEYSADKVIVKSDGTVTYTGKDIAYHLWKFGALGTDFLYSPWRNSGGAHKGLVRTDAHGSPRDGYGRADRVYNVIDVRQTYPQSMVRFALEQLGFAGHAQNMKHVSYGVVSLSSKTFESLDSDSGGQTKGISMSGRKGIGVKVDDLYALTVHALRSRTYAVQTGRHTESVRVEEIVAGAIKYCMLRYHPQSDIVFDLDDALTLQGNTGVYVQYAHARAAGILEKAGMFTPPVKVLATPEESRLLKKLHLWPWILEVTAQDLNINRITTYAHELATLFNSFYEAQQVLKADGAARGQRLLLVSAYKNVCADVLDVLGMAAPDAM